MPTPIPLSSAQIVKHGNTNQIFRVFGQTRREYVAVAGSTVAQQIAADINSGGVIDRRPGAPAELLGNDAVHFLESKTIV